MNPYKELIDTEIQGKNILLREDLNVPSKNSEIVKNSKLDNILFCSKSTNKILCIK